MDEGHHLAQLNIGRVRHPLDHPEMRGFVEQLDYINAIADASTGFVWRLQTEDGNATAFRPFGEDDMLANMSVWKSVEALYDYTYRSDHLAVMRGRRQWFEPLGSPHMVLWWIPAGHIPTLEEAIERLERLRRNGPTPDAFDFRQPYGTDGRMLRLRGHQDWASCDAG
jgi:hypothetical protein